MNSASSSRGPRHSVVIVTYNSRENIQVCLDSLRRTSARGDLPEIIVVDNASRDGTPDYLSRQDDVIAVLNADNRGFSRACNQGAARATGEFVTFLNPDTLVTEGWLEAMSGYFRDPAVGAAGPLSNYVAGLQRLDLHLPSPYKEGAKFPGADAVEQSAAVARVLREANAGRGVTTRLLIGFCLMMRASLYREIGGMDEKLFLGNDDLDLSWRLRNLGLKLVVASDAFVFHEGQKSFQTEKKSHVDRLVQESTDALYLKLVDHYGGRDKVPSSVELWGMNWFTPSPALLQGEHPRTAEAPMAMPALETKPQAQAWKGVTALVWLAADDRGDEAQRLDRTLASLPAQPCDIVVVNCSPWKGASSRADVRRLDLGPGCPPRTALELALGLAQERVLFVLAGVGSTALFNHWLDKRAAALGEAPVALSVRAEGRDDGSEEAGVPGGAFLAGQAWLRAALGSVTASPADLAGALGARIARETAPGVRSDAPWLIARAEDLPARPRAEEPSWTPAPAPVAAPAAPAVPALAAVPPAPGAWDRAIDNYPKVLAPAMRAAREIGFAGSPTDLPPADGPFHVLDMKGERVPFGSQDLVILRLIPEMVDGLEKRLANLRRRGQGLERLMVVLNPAQALGRAGDGLLAPADVTPAGARAALWRAGFAVVSEKPYEGLATAPGAPAPDFTGWSLVEAVPRARAHDEGKKVSIVILGFNQVEYTKKCIESIRRHTRQAYELILVDNGSKDGTEEFFRSVPGAKVIRNAENLGVSRGWNQGMRLATGDYVLIFNNDTIVGPGWLENMVRLCGSDPSIGMVGPRSNYIAGPQVVKDVPYRDEAGIEAFIRSWQADHDLQADEFDWIKGFCLLIPRKVADQVGFFDERFGKGNFEDDDYCLRVRLHGYRTLIAHDAFIHHYGSVSFNQEDVDWKALMVENRRKYEEKWSRGRAALHDTVSIGAPGAPAASSPAPAAPAAAASAASVPELAAADRAYASGDIAAARRLYLEAQARHPRLADPLCGLGVLAFHDGAHLDAGTLFLQCLELDPRHRDAAANLLDILKAHDDALQADDLEALVARFPRNPVFETALAGLRSQEGSAGAAPAPEPLPAWRAEVEERIGRRDFGPALDALERRIRAGQDRAVCFNYMGVIAHACGDRVLAEENFRQAVAAGPRDADPVYNLVDTLLQQGRARDALRLLESPPALADAAAEEEAGFAAAAEQVRHALESGAPDPARLLASREAGQEAERLLRRGAYADAAAVLEARLREDAGDFRARNGLGLAAWYRGRAQEAWEHFRACLALRPAWTDALVNGFDAGLAAGKSDGVRALAEAALAARPGHPEATRMLAHVEREGLALAGCRSFEALERDSAILARAEKALQEGRKADAIYGYLEAIEARPENPQALNGLGIVAFAEKRHVDAYALFEAAAALNPLDQDILVNLWQAAQALRKEDEVRPRLRSSLQRNPALADVKAILESA